MKPAASADQSGFDADSTDTLDTIGEVAALRRIFPLLPDAAAALLGPGDDAAVLAAPDGRYVVTTDMMVHGPDFRWAWSTPEDLGWKAAATNLADVAAMGARPTAIVVAIAAPADTTIGVLERFADGLRAACEALAPGCGVVGGDLSASSVFTIAVTAFGDLEGRAPVLRSGAAAGDLVAITGSVGSAAHGLHLLFEHGTGEDGSPDRSRAQALRDDPHVRAQLRPEPPIASGTEAAIAGATAMLDVSDGLCLDAGRLAAASGVAIDIETAALRAAMADGVELAEALAGGEEHALLACFPANAVLPAAFRRVGTVRAGSGVLVDGTPRDEATSSSTGWDPYSGWDGAVG